MKKLTWISVSGAAGLSALSIAALGSVPPQGRITDDTAIYQNLSEIRVNKEKELNFDPEINRLSALEGHYKERLPSLAQRPSLQGPLQRIAQKKYRPTPRQAVAHRVASHHVVTHHVAKRHN